MGLFGSYRVDPNSQSASSSQANLLEWRGDVSRVNFKFLRKLQTWGVDAQAVLWLACNINNPKQKFFVRQIDKYKVYNHKRIEAVMNELRLLTQSDNEFIIKVYFAFQDYENLYLVSEALDSLSFEQILQSHDFTEDEEEAQYVITGLISIIEYVHSHNFAITELSPSNIHIDINTGCLKLVGLSNPAVIDTRCASNTVSDVCAYSAPEILYRDKVIAECDFYSLGLIMYEMMTRTAIVLPEGIGAYARNEILKVSIEVEKSQIPEKWSPQSADFLIKLLIKNPALRLGRFGSFEVKNHPWLGKLEMSSHLKNRIQLREGQRNRKGGSDDSEKLAVRVEYERPGIEDFSKDYFFQSLFQNYSYKKLVAEQSQKSVSVNERQSGVQRQSSLSDGSHWKLGESVT